MTTTGLFQIAAVVTGFGGIGADVKITGGVSEPTKSAVVGMLAAADGRKHGESIDDLNALKIGTMTLNQGVPHARFGSITGNRTLNATTPFRENPLIRRRTFFQAAHQSETGDWLIRHLIAFQSEDQAFVEHLLKRLVVPVFPIFIGRKNCLPSEPLALGSIEGTLFDAFKLVKVKGKATIEVVPSMQIKHKMRQLDVIDNFRARRVLSRMVVKQTI